MVSGCQTLRQTIEYKLAQNKAAQWKVSPNWKPSTEQLLLV